jgi:glycosyltransferase involved in cell wall biosynthesis
MAAQVMNRELESNGLIVMYVGNLEAYQGIDLLLESFARVLKKTGQPELIIIGGHPTDIQKYREKAQQLGISPKVRFWGPRPLEELGQCLATADILVSPRIKGRNTPMKLYSYLDSGRPVLATDLPTHTQVLNRNVAMLAEPIPDAFATAMLRLIDDKDLRFRLGRAAKQLVQAQYTYRIFHQNLNALYDWLATVIERERHLTFGGRGHMPRRGSSH